MTRLLGAGFVALMTLGVGTAMGLPVAQRALRAEDRSLDRAELAVLARSSTVRVAGRTCGLTLTGSGFVAEGVLVTNRHLVGDNATAKVDQPGSPRLMDVARVSAQLDLATLGPVDSRALDLAEQNAPVGSGVLFAGHAAGGETVVRDATVHLYTAGEGYGLSGPIMLLDGASAPGFSGGPVLDSSGKVVGVLQGYEPNLQLTIAVPVSAVEGWLASGPDRTAPNGTGAAVGGEQNMNTCP